MKAVIIGGGSIGKRHSKNLNDLGVLTRIIDVDEINNIDTILSKGFDLGLVCTPNTHHINHCYKLAKYNIPIFCEKPFYSNSKGVNDLLSLVERKNLITMVGCNLRFIPEIKNINPNSKYISVYFGYDLKRWRPGTDHLKSYSANKNLGGGVLLDVIHELDYLYYKFGAIKNISYLKNKISNVTIDTEDLVTGRIEFKNGTIADFALNYLSEEYQRYYDILDSGILKRNYLKINNQMYIDEIKYFINCIKTETQGMNSFKEAYNLLKEVI